MLVDIIKAKPIVPIEKVVIELTYKEALTLKRIVGTNATDHRNSWLRSARMFDSTISLTDDDFRTFSNNLYGKFKDL